MNMRIVQLMVIICCIYLKLSATASDALECSCTTTECVKSNKLSCTAEHRCYVQALYVQHDPQSGEYTQDAHLQVTRGCISASMPLLCENRRPDGYAGPWPVLHCCKEDWCNHDTLPTDPPWLAQEKERMLQEAKTAKNQNLHHLKPETRSENNYDNAGTFYRKTSSYDESENSGKSRRRPNGDPDKDRIHILFIAIPLAVACLVLGFIIFILYLLKINRQTTKKQQLHSLDTQSKAITNKLPGSNIVLTSTTNAKQLTWLPSNSCEQRLLACKSKNVNNGNSVCHHQKQPLMVHPNHLNSFENPHQYCYCAGGSTKCSRPPISTHKPLNSPINAQGGCSCENCVTKHAKMTIGTSDQQKLQHQMSRSKNGRFIGGKSCDSISPMGASPTSCDYNCMKSADQDQKSCDCGSCEGLVGSETKLLM